MTHESDSTPSPRIETIATELLPLFAAGDRAEAERLLLHEVLPWDLRNLATHSAPERLAQLVAERLRERLSASPEAERLAGLRAGVCDRTAQKLVGRAIALAVARFSRRHSVPDSAGLQGYLEEADVFRDLTEDELAATADRLATELDAWENGARSDHPVCWQAHRINLFHATTALAAARTGSFATSSGPLHNFLRRAGHRSRRLEAH